MSVFIYCKNETFSASSRKEKTFFSQEINYFNLDVRANNSTGWGGAAVSIGACGASDPGANPGPDLYSFEGFNKSSDFELGVQN